MTDEKKSELTDRERKFGGWTDEKFAEYTEARNKAMAERIFGPRNRSREVEGR